MRLALYIAMRKQGKSAGEAAQAAKSVTVDFDRKGSMTGAMGAIYLFFNPAVQGTANAIKPQKSSPERCHGPQKISLGGARTGPIPPQQGSPSGLPRNAARCPKTLT